MTSTTLHKRPLGGWFVYSDDSLLGWVVRRGEEWHAYVAGSSIEDRGRFCGWGASRREAVDEVIIESACSC